MPNVAEKPIPLGKECKEILAEMLGDMSPLPSGRDAELSVVSSGKTRT